MYYGCIHISIFQLVCTIPMSHMPKPMIKGDKITVVILREEYIVDFENAK